MKKTILYYTCNTHRPEIDELCRDQLRKVPYRVVSVSLNKSIDFGDTRIVMEGNRSAEMLHKQIARGLQEIDSGCVFFCENDVLYHLSHFDFTPPRQDVFYYNEHTYKKDFFSGRAVFYYTKQTSGLCADIDLLKEHYAKRIERINQDGRYDRRIGFEPGCHKFPRGVDASTAERWMSTYPNVDIRHDKNFTKSKWSLGDFRDLRTSIGWREIDQIPHWENIEK